VSYLKFDEEFRKKYYIPDLTEKQDEIKVIFILESPHSDEIICRYPAAGDTGIAMTKALGLNQEKLLPLGKLVHDHRIKIIGIMNVCPIPMQVTPYCYCDKLEEILEAFNTIRNTSMNVKKRNNEETQKIEEVLINDFGKRFEKVYRKDILLIPCGRMANYCLKKYNQEIYKSDQTIEGIPHPSRNNWDRKKFKKQIKKMKEKIKKYLG